MGTDQIAGLDRPSAEHTPSDEEVTNDDMFLEDAGLVRSHPKNWVEAEQTNSYLRLKLVIAVCLFALAIDIFFIVFTFQDLPLLVIPIWWVIIQGYLKLPRR
ncbi:MAG: hypothetical protein NTX26_03500 [Candidatus Parcubacteria bacterium]|nr:hypothetical protein [Candidatus Parcubacteria bacterium]